MKIVAASQHKRQRKKSYLTNENSDTNARAANELLKYFCKLAKQTETIRNYLKQFLVMIKHCLGNSQINLIRE